MKAIGNRLLQKQRGALAAVALLCLLPCAAWSQPAESTEDNTGIRHLSGFEFLSPQGQFATGPLILASDGSGGLAFDTGGSENRKLQLQLAQPLTLHAGTMPLSLANGDSLLTSAGLGWTVSEELRLGASLRQQSNRFQALGSIHCENGILDAESYRASNCYFTNEPVESSSSTLALGAQYRVNENVAAGINLFRQQANANGIGSSVGGSLLTPTITDALRVPGSRVLPGHLDSEVSGIDLEFRLGYATDTAGEMQLGLQFTRVLDAQFDAPLPFQGGLSQWTLADPVDSARLSFDWRRNAFSGGIQGLYREPMSFLNRSETDATTMFDVYFSWRTPWNASLSVGASNLLNSGGDENKPADNNIVDPFESVYGRIPYVRYQQDL